MRKLGPKVGPRVGPKVGPSEGATFGPPFLLFFRGAQNGTRKGAQN